MPWGMEHWPHCRLIHFIDDIYKLLYCRIKAKRFQKQKNIVYNKTKVSEKIIPTFTQIANYDMQMVNIPYVK